MIYLTTNYSLLKSPRMLFHLRYPWTEAVEGMLVIRLRGAGSSSPGVRTAVRLRRPRACHRHAAAARRVGLNGDQPPSVVVADFSFQVGAWYDGYQEIFFSSILCKKFLIHTRKQIWKSNTDLKIECPFIWTWFGPTIVWKLSMREYKVRNGVAVSLLTNLMLDHIGRVETELLFWEAVQHVLCSNSRCVNSRFEMA